MKIRFIPLILVLILILSGCAFSPVPTDRASSASGSSASSTPAPSVSRTSASDWPDTPVSNFDYEYDGTLKGVVITNYKGTNSLKVRVPDTIDGEPIVGIRYISDGSGCYGGVMAVYLPDSLKIIGSDAFSNSDLTSIKIPAGVTEIGERAFIGNKGLSEIIIPDGVTKIGNSAFAHSDKLLNIIIPDSVAEIGYGAFSDCTGLTKVTIGRGVTELSDSLFMGCTALTEITIPESVTKIDERALGTELVHISVSPDNSVYTDIDGVLYSKDKSVLVRFPAGKSGAYKLPAGVREIGAYSVSWSYNLTSLDIPDGATRIGENAFGYCENLTHVKIPDSVTEIEESAFQGCTALDNTTRQRILEIVPNYNLPDTVLVP